jgi:hypothetical protein
LIKISNLEHFYFLFLEYIEVEIIQKGTIAIGYGGTTRINASIVSNSTGSLEVNWLQLPVQLVLKVESSNPIHREVYSI